MAEQPPRRVRPTPEMVAGSAPWLPAEYIPADATAMQALAAGTANPEQQKRAIRWIIENAAGTYDMSYRPGTEGERDTSFAEGRRYVGNQIVKLLKISVAAIRRGPNSDTPGENG